MTPYKLEPLPYDYDALEPFIDRETMIYHHDNHTGNYVANLNKIIAEYNYTNLPGNIEEWIPSVRSSAIESQDRNSLIFNAGGVANHYLFFSLLKKNNGAVPDGDLAVAINANFGSFENFKSEFTKAALSQLGSGWVWLCVDPFAKKLVIKEKPYPVMFITTTSNHDNPMMIGATKDFGSPILCLDLWEHTYYLRYQYRKSEFYRAFWDIINWDRVVELYRKSLIEKF